MKNIRKQVLNRSICKHFGVASALLLSVSMSSTSSAMGKSDDPWLTKVTGELEFLREDGADVVEWEIDSWLGQDLRKFWIKTEGEYERSDDESEVESAQFDFVYSQAISTYWDVQYGLRQDIRPKIDGNTRTWLVFGYRGLAQGFWDVDANLYVGEESSVQLDLEFEKELMLTQKWVLIPELDATFNGDTNERYGEGSGLSVIEASLRIGYEPNRKFQTFIGLSGTQTFGATKSIRKSEGDKSGSLNLIAGIEFWF